MKTTNSFGIYFNIRPDKEKDGKAPVFVGITVNGQKVLMVLQQKIAVKCWDMKKGMGKSNTAEGREVNTYLEQVRQSIGDCYKDLQVQRKVITAELIKAAFLRTGSDEHTLVYIMEMLTTLFRAKLTTGLADFWVAANAIKACTKIVI